MKWRCCQFVGFVLVLLGLGVSPLRAQTLRGEGAFPEVLKPMNRSAEEAVRWLEPFVEPGGSISVVQGQILVRGSRANVQKLRQILAGLEQGPRRLRIQMRQAGGASWLVQGEADEGQSAVLRTEGAGLLVRARRVPTGVRVEILDPAETPDQRSHLLAVVNGRQGHWLPAGAGLEIRVVEASDPQRR